MEATKPAAPNLLQQQARFDAFMARYNHDRPGIARFVLATARVHLAF
jgi:hypothetical protein